MTKKYKFEDLLEIMEKLRAPGGCPWDQEQTHESLTKCMIEEAYEAVDAINEGSKEKIIEELGDVLLQVVFHAQIGKENKTFDIDDISHTISEKLVYRHPHIFKNEVLKDSQAVLRRWEDLKKQEKGHTSVTQSMESVPRNFPALMRASKVQKKAQLVGFDWPDIEGALLKIKEETKELEETILEKDKDRQMSEMGDLLFSVVNVCRFLDIDPEKALNNSSDKFIKRFSYVEEKCLDNHLKMEEMTIEELDKFWDEGKNEGR